MKREIGDILPDESDNVRFDTIKHLEGYYQSIIENCPKCEGVGSYISKHKKVRIKCGCNTSFKIILELLKSNFPQMHLNITTQELFQRTVVELDVSSPDQKVGNAFNFNKVFMNKFIQNYEFMISNSCSSLFVGNNETGKTYAALYMLAELVKRDVSGHYLRFKNYLNLLNSSYNNMDDRKLLNQVRKVKFLIIDELGKEHGKAEYATCELEELIKYRQDNLSCTILISNLDYNDFVKTYGNHVKSAFNKNFKILVFHPDAELRKKTRIKWPT